MFKLIKKDKKTKRRVGLLKTRNGVIETPFFMPIATKGAVKGLTPEDLKSLGADLILGNTYHLWLRPGTEIIKKAGDLHGFMNWPGPILTDSGGYQVFSLGSKIIKNNSLPCEGPASLSLQRGEEGEGGVNSVDHVRQNHSFVKISDEGAEFRDPIDGNKYFLTPEKSIEIQLALGSDIIMVLDECPPAFVKTSAGKPYPVSREQVEKAVARTTAWAARCKKYFDKKTNPSTSLGVKNYKLKTGKPLLFGIVQGGVHKDLRERSARELLAIGFDGYAIGGVAVGEPRKYLATVLDAVTHLLPEDKPRYLMGLGKPEEIVAAVNAGIDMFDCVIPTREARHGKLYIYKKASLRGAAAGADPSFHSGQAPQSRASITGSPRPATAGLATTGADFYETINILNAKFARDFAPIDKNCGCYSCQNYTRAYLHHLFKVGEPLSLRLATIHNLKFYLGLMESLRK